MKRVRRGALQSVLLLATSTTAACFGATTSLVAVSSRTAPADSHSQAVGIVRLRAARAGPRQLAVHADRGAGRADRGRRHPPGRRRAARRRHQDAQGRHARTAALRLRRAARPAGRARLAVEVHRMPSRGLCRVGVRRAGSSLHRWGRGCQSLGIITGSRGRRAAGRGAGSVRGACSVGWCVRVRVP
jgi:hypothetical protein